MTVWSIADASGERDLEAFAEHPELIRCYASSGKAPSAILTYLIETAVGPVLIDTGNGRSAGPNPSLLPQGLAKAGFAPDQVAVVLITHMHGDHIGGLLREGEAAFPGARVLIGGNEADFWLNPDSPAAFPDLAANFALAKKVVETYGDRVEYFAFGDVVVPGITALEAAGHTPGHTAFLIESGGERLLCVGDLLNSAALQFPRPDINASYDMADQASATRKRYLSMAAEENIPIAGMHIPFPGIGRVEKAGEGFAFLPGLK